MTITNKYIAIENKLLQICNISEASVWHVKEHKFVIFIKIVVIAILIGIFLQINDPSSLRLYDINNFLSRVGWNPNPVKIGCIVVAALIVINIIANNMNYEIRLYTNSGRSTIFVVKKKEICSSSYAVD
jgi:hypothetical protein